jgi:hypothetical protein
LVVLQESVPLPVWLLPLLLFAGQPRARRPFLLRPLLLRPYFFPPYFQKGKR